MSFNSQYVLTVVLTLYLCSLPHSGPRDVEKGVLVITVPTKTVPICQPPIQPLQPGIAAPTGQACPSGSVCLPPLGPWPFQAPYHHKPPSRYPNGFRPVRLADGPFPAKGGHVWNVPYQQSNPCGSGSLPIPTAMSGTAMPLGTGIGDMTTSTGVSGVASPTGNSTDYTPMSSGVDGVAMPTGTTGTIFPAPLGNMRH